MIKKKESQNFNHQTPFFTLMSLKEKRIKELQKIDELILAAMPKKIEDVHKKIELRIGFFHIFRFASAEDRIMMILGSIAAIINGACIPMFGILYGEVRDAMIKEI